MVSGESVFANVLETMTLAALLIVSAESVRLDVADTGTVAVLDSVSADSVLASVADSATVAEADAVSFDSVTDSVALTEPPPVASGTSSSAQVTFHSFPPEIVPEAETVSPDSVTEKVADSGTLAALDSVSPDSVTDRSAVIPPTSPKTQAPKTVGAALFGAPLTSKSVGLLLLLLAISKPVVSGFFPSATNYPCV